MYWAIFAFLTFCFGVGMWEFLVIEQSKKLRGNDYRSNLPRSFSSPVFKLLTLAGHSGIIIVPLIGWSRGFLWAVGSTAVFVILGAAIGFAIPRAIGALASV